MRFIFATAFLFLLLANVSAQTPDSAPNSTLGSDFKFGINLGLNYSNAFVDEQLPSNAMLSNGLGFRLEVMAEYKVSKRFFISPTAGFSFNNVVLYDGANGELTEFLIFPISLDLATHFMIKPNLKKHRPYFYVGPALKLPVEAENPNSAVFASTWTPAVDLGFGFDIDLGYFHLAPEIRYSLGLYVVSVQPPSNGIYFHNVSFIFNFFG